MQYHEKKFHSELLPKRKVAAPPVTKAGGSAPYNTPGINDKELASALLQIKQPSKIVEEIEEQIRVNDAMRGAQQEEKKHIPEEKLVPDTSDDDLLNDSQFLKEMQELFPDTSNKDSEDTTVPVNLDTVGSVSNDEAHSECEVGEDSVCEADNAGQTITSNGIEIPIEMVHPQASAELENHNTRLEDVWELCQALGLKTTKEQLSKQDDVQLEYMRTKLKEDLNQRVALLGEQGNGMADTFIGLIGGVGEGISKYLNRPWLDLTGFTDVMMEQKEMYRVALVQYTREHPEVIKHLTAVNILILTTFQCAMTCVNRNHTRKAEEKKEQLIQSLQYGGQAPHDPPNTVRTASPVPPKEETSKSVKNPLPSMEKPSSSEQKLTSPSKSPSPALPNSSESTQVNGKGWAKLFLD